MAENKSDGEPEEEKEAEPAKPSEEGSKEDAEGDEKSAAATNGTAENATDGDGNSTTNGTGKYNKNYLRGPGREDGDFGFDEPERIETHPNYRKEMTRHLGKTKKMKRDYGYYGYGGHRGADRYGDAADLFEDDSSENDKEKEGYYPADDEEE